MTKGAQGEDRAVLAEQEPWQSVPTQGRLIAGCDEAGRGPLAGNVVAAAVILDPNHPIHGLNDSKKLSEKARERLFDQIQNEALAVSVGRASPAEIDDINILQASLLAMRRAVEGLSLVPHFVFVDGNRLPTWDVESLAVVKGDGKIACVSAASIVAKVVRDRELLELDARYPGYGFAQHKGYPTAAHLDALARLGASAVHRQSFAPVARARPPR
jgi:ribonuclease HII